MTPTIDTIIAEMRARVNNVANPIVGAAVVNEWADKLAALPAPGEWLPIESAPKDGSFMWLGDPLNIRLAFWNLSQQRWVDLGKIEAREAVIGLHFEPTHWHAMPRPPLAAAQGEE